jgi:hypothetical protein
MADYYKKTEYVEAITQHLAKEGKRMTNLKKASISQLHSMALDKFNIDMMLFVNIRKTEMKVKARDARNQKTKEAFERQQREEAYQKQKQEEENKINDFKRTTHMDLNVIKNKWVLQEQLKDKQYFKDNQEKIEKNNKASEDFKNRLAKSLDGVVHKTGFVANGVNVECLGLFDYIEPTEQILRDRYNEGRTLYMLSNLNINEEVDYDSDESELIISSDSDSD